jgi:hypothetical protein
MTCERLEFSGHAIQRMFERAISWADVRTVIAQGEVIMEYPDDRPYPSRLLLGFVDERPIHIVIGIDDATDSCYVITVYVPDPGRWSDDFRMRKPQS